MGLHYPSVDLKQMTLDSPIEKYLPDRVEVEWEEYLELARPIQEFLGVNTLIWPNTKLGPSMGRIKKAPDAINSSYACDMYLREDAFMALDKCGINLKVAKSRVRPHKKHILTLYDVEIPAVASLNRAKKESRCRYCGLSEMSEDIVVDKSSVPRDVDVFKLREDPFRIVLSERFVDFVEKLGLTGMPVNPVKVE